MMTRISVIVPIYNTKLYLEEAINSILQQKKYLFEIIIINDGSTDGSESLLEELYGKNELIQIHHTGNNGQGHARNLGTNLASGDFIYYFDSDDIAVVDLFDKFFQSLSSMPDLELFCFSGESFLDSKLSIESISRPSELSKVAFKRNISTSCNSGEEAFRLLVNKNSFTPVPWLYIFKKAILLKNNFKFRTIKYEDEEFTHQLFIHAGKTHIINDVLFYRRVREGSTMQIKRTFQDLLGYFKTIETLQELKSLNFLEPSTKKILESRIVVFIKIIIKQKTTSKISLTRHEKRKYLKYLIPFLKGNIGLIAFYIRFPIEYKLRKFKQKYFPKPNVKS